MNRSAFPLAALLALVVACSESSGPDVSGDISVRSTGIALAVTNTGDQHVYYIVIERSDLPVIDWVPCTSGEESCPHVHARETLSIPYSQIMAYSAGDDEAVFFWWHLVRDGAVLRVDEIREIVVEL